MFLSNKYKVWYDSICQSRISRKRQSGVTERHHIIPRAFGGTDLKENLVNLTYREHFLVHWLLTKCTEGKRRIKMLNALWRMSLIPGQYERKISSWQYSVARRAASLRQSLVNMGNQYSKGRRLSEKECLAIGDRSRGKHHTAEARAKISEARKGYKYGAETLLKRSLSLKGKEHSLETRRKIGVGNRGKIRSIETRERIRQARLGSKASLETRKKMSLSARKRYERLRSIDPIGGIK